jgi:uncharacterized protein (DUF427 family)
VRCIATRGGARLFAPAYIKQCNDAREQQGALNVARALFNGSVIAESETYELVEGNVYFPPDSIKREYFRASARHTTCPWKGEASYLDVVVGEKSATNAAWYYPKPSAAARNIKNFVAFYPAAKVEP